MTRKIIIDCDPGFDDMVALLLALASPEVEVLGVTAVAGNVPLADTSRNALRVLELAGRTDVPVYAGCPLPILREQVFGKYAASGGLGGDLLPPPVTPVAEGHAVDFIIAAATAASERGESIIVCAQAPLTNIALALLKGGEAVRAGLERVVVMGGAFAALGNRVPWAEFNFYADPHAAAVVLRSGVPVDLFPLDVTFQALLTAAHVEKLRAAAGKVGETVAALLKMYDRNDPVRFGREGGPIHDPMLVASLIRPELFAHTPAWVGVRTDGDIAGHSYADMSGKTGRASNVRLATRVDEAGYLDLVMERLALYGGRDGR